ncbi:rho termination factor [Leptolyngbya sp. Heron Island J]|uniref:Rho termination factor N-terminal domain-containing protein n=1 Tax=Leptolyngbya sp. Heron Island J TaxID=1385935 RepID=UPI0003B940DA|nr:Rho termination factor N-terminal domain-containing protein [Leptolyngbya sp. Heron Island J]ESA34755.1 rho termination factor [Leptolyngbya sp. Heron Island J]
MASLSDIGNLMHLYLDEIEPGEATPAPEFLIQASAQVLNQKCDRNWVPIIVKETGEDQYQVIGNSFIYAVAEEAGLERVWCVVADDSDETAEVARVLSGEEIPRINLSKASHDEITAALQYLIELPGSDLKKVKLATAVNRIEEAPRQYWKTLDPIANLKCGITRGKKLNTLKSVFYLTPQPMPEVITDPVLLKGLTATELKKMAKKRGITGYSKMKKAELINVLSESGEE